MRRFILLILLPLFFFYNDAVMFIPVTIKGVVLDAQTGRPLSGMYVYVTKGEEEGLTDKRGAFSITTWRPLPVPVTVQAEDTVVMHHITTVQAPLRILVRQKMKLRF